MFESALGCGGWSQAGWQHPQAGIVNLDADFLYVPCASEELQALAWEKSARHIVGQQLRGMGKGGRAVCMGVFGLSGAWRGSAGGGQHS